MQLWSVTDVNTSKTNMVLDRPIPRKGFRKMKRTDTRKQRITQESSRNLQSQKEVKKVKFRKIFARNSNNKTVN